MFNHRTNGYEKKDKNGNPTGKYTNAQDNYTCSTYSKAKSKFENRCTQHHVRTDVIRDLLLEVIKVTSTYVMEHEAEFIELVHRYTDFTELNTLMIHEFVDKIVVHEADKSTGDRIQQIDIYLKYVGKLDILMPELTPEQIKEEDKCNSNGFYYSSYCIIFKRTAIIFVFTYRMCNS